MPLDSHRTPPAYRHVGAVPVTHHPCGCVTCSDPLRAVWLYRALGFVLSPTVTCAQHTPKDPHAPPTE